jgi:hypothetical protein
MVRAIIENDEQSMMNKIVMDSWKKDLKLPEDGMNMLMMERLMVELEDVDQDPLDALKWESYHYRMMRRDARKRMPELTRNVDKDTTSFLSMDLDDDEIDVGEELQQMREKKASFKKEMGAYEQQHQMCKS